MRQYIALDFDQQRAMELNLNFKQILLLSYIRDAMVDDSLKHAVKDEVCYVWLNHQKILDDIPIIDVSKVRLRQLFVELTDLELIKTDQEINSSHGSRVYYTITAKGRQLWIRDTNESPKMETQITARVSKNGDSDNTPILDNNLNTLNTKEQIEADTAIKDPDSNKRDRSVAKEKPKKQDLYTKCVQFIMEYTDHFKLQKALVRYLDTLLEIHRSEGKPLYFNMFVGKLNRLSTFPEDDRLEIVELSTSNGWKNFYALKAAKTQVANKFKDEAVSDHYTEQELEQLAKKDEERKKRGLQTKF